MLRITTARTIPLQVPITSHREDTLGTLTFIPQSSVDQRCRELDQLPEASATSQQWPTTNSTVDISPRHHLALGSTSIRILTMGRPPKSTLASRLAVRSYRWSPRSAPSAFRNDHFRLSYSP